MSWRRRPTWIAEGELGDFTPFPKGRVVATKPRPGYLRRTIRGPLRWTAEDEEVYREYLAGIPAAVLDRISGGVESPRESEVDEDGD